jgi:hypothetical protein
LYGVDFKPQMWDVNEWKKVHQNIGLMQACLGGAKLTLFIAGITFLHQVKGGLWMQLWKSR